MKALALAGALLLATPAAGQDTLLRSDLPLWAGGVDGASPYAFSTPEGDFGCATGFPTGRWRLVPPDGEPGSSLSLHNYGVFHCALMLTEGDGPADADAPSEITFHVPLGRIRIGRTEHELSALQIGFRGGSDYLLLSRPAGPGRRERFSVLEPACARPRRLAEDADIWRSDYCVVRTRAELRRTAREAALRAPAAVLERIGDLPPEPEGD